MVDLEKYEADLKRCEESFAGLPDLPYHNFAHCKSVAFRALRGARFYSLPPREATVLVRAAIFHDAGYLHAEDDAVNTAAAAKVWGEGGVVEKLILSTTNPWVPPAKDDLWGLHKKILRDADILQTCEDGWALKLEAELGVESDLNWVKEHLTTMWGMHYFIAREG